MDEATFRRRQAKGAYKGLNWESFHAAEVANERALEQMRREQKQISDDYAAHVRDRQETRKRADSVFRPILQGLTTVADAAAEGLSYAGPVGKVASAAYKVFAPPGSKHYKRTWGEKLVAAGKEAIGAVGLPKSLGGVKLDALRGAMPSAARGGRVARGGKVRVHKNELVVRKAAAPRLIKLLKRTGVALPLSAIKAKSKK